MYSVLTSMNVWHQVEAVITMQCAQILLALEHALVKWDIQGMEQIVKTSMNV